MPKEAASPVDWARWLAQAGNAVVGDFTSSDGVIIHTRFIGIELPDTRDHVVLPPNAPLAPYITRRLLFETLILGGEHDHHVERYDTWKEAAAGHVRWVTIVSQEQRPGGRAITLGETR